MPDGVVVWFTGLPSSGKSTVAAAVAESLRRDGASTAVLDGDLVRNCIVPAHGYSARARADFYETLARLAALLAEQGHVVLVPATAARAAFRARARALAPRFVEVFVDVPLDACIARDAKGLYAAEVAALPGIAVPYEAPARPDVAISGASTGDVARVRRVIREVGGA